MSRGCRAPGCLTQTAAAQHSWQLRGNGGHPAARTKLEVLVLNLRPLRNRALAQPLALAARQLRCRHLLILTVLSASGRRLAPLLLRGARRQQGIIIDVRQAVVLLLALAALAAAAALQLLARAALLLALRAVRALLQQLCGW